MFLIMVVTKGPISGLCMQEGLDMAAGSLYNYVSNRKVVRDESGND